MQEHARNFGAAAATVARPAAGLGVGERSQFIMRTYAHLFGAVMLFIAIEMGLFATGLAYRMAQAMAGTSWLLILGGFVVAGWLATHFAHRAESLAAQYLGLGLYVAAQAVIFVLPLVIASVSMPGAISTAAMITVVGFAGLTAVVFTTRKDFSFLGAILRWGMIVALVLIVAGVLFGFNLGVFFSVAMVALAGGSILYDTSNVLHHYPKHRYVGAALQLFSSLALLFWYVLRLVMAFSSRD